MKYTELPVTVSGGKPITVGIPRAFLYFRHITLWKTFFRDLGIRVIVSEPTNLKIEQDGMNAAIDEMCLSMKIYLGHVKSLIGRCDYILVPRVVSYGIRRVMCTTFWALPDLVRNIFYKEHVNVLSFNVNGQENLPEEKAMVAMAKSLGCPAGAAKKAYRHGRKAMQQEIDAAAKRSEALYKKKGLKVAIAGHSYVVEDEYIGKPVMDALRKMGVITIRSDLVNRKKAREQANKISPTLKWELSREIAGSIAMHIHDIDGIVLLSVYPCALDSMVNDMIVRKAEGTKVPILQLTLDAQSGTAGIETRLESFIDILRMRNGTLTEDASDVEKEAV